jgi:hypothetical protein
MNKTAYLGQETTDPEVLEQIEELAARSGVAAVVGCADELTHPPGEDPAGG